MAIFDNILSLLAVGILWGATNPLIKRGSEGIEKVRARNSKLQWFYEVKYLVTRWQYVIPFILNQCGSVLYYFALGSSDLSLVVPVANSLTFVATAICGWALGEELPNKNTCIGIVFILSGITLCFVAKS